MKAGDSEVSVGHTAHQIGSTIVQSGVFFRKKLFDYFYEDIKVLRIFPPNYL